MIVVGVFLLLGCIVWCGCFLVFVVYVLCGICVVGIWCGYDWCVVLVVCVSICCWWCGVCMCCCIVLFMIISSCVWCGGLVVFGWFGVSCELVYVSGLYVGVWYVVCIVWWFFVVYWFWMCVVCVGILWYVEVEMWDLGELFDLVSRWILLVECVFWWCVVVLMWFVLLVVVLVVDVVVIDWSGYW